MISDPPLPVGAEADGGGMGGGLARLLIEAASETGEPLFTIVAQAFESTAP